MSDATFTGPDLTTFARLDGLGLEVVGQRLEPDRVVVAFPLHESHLVFIRRTLHWGTSRPTTGSRFAIRAGTRSQSCLRSQTGNALTRTWVCNDSCVSVFGVNSAAAGRSRTGGAEPCSLAAV